MSRYDRAAEALHSYISYRAQKEGVEYALSPEFFREALAHRCVEFFGVVVRDGELVRDKQFPELFTMWQKNQQLN